MISLDAILLLTVIALFTELHYTGMGCPGTDCTIAWKFPYQLATVYSMTESLCIINIEQYFLEIYYEGSREVYNKIQYLYEKIAVIIFKTMYKDPTVLFCL